jgi:hypothetical protein
MSKEFSSGITRLQLVHLPLLKRSEIDLLRNLKQKQGFLPLFPSFEGRETKNCPCLLPKMLLNCSDQEEL